MYQIYHGYWQPVGMAEPSSQPPIVSDALNTKIRMEELEREQSMARDVDVAHTIWLDMHGERAGVPRVSGEGDSDYRARIKKELAK